MTTLSIHEMAERTGLSAHTLRYYEQIGVLRPVDRDASSKHRAYQESDLFWANFIKCLRATGMPLREMIRYAELVRAGDATIPQRLQLLEEHQRRVEERQRQIGFNLAAITAKVAVYRERRVASAPVEVDDEPVAASREEAAMHVW